MMGRLFMRQRRGWSMNKWLKGFIASVCFGVFCAACWIGAQVATSTTFAQIPSGSPGGSLNFLTDGCLFARNTNGTGTRTWFVLPVCASVTPPATSSNWTLVTAGAASKADSGNSVTLTEVGTAYAGGLDGALLKAVPSAPYTRTIVFKSFGVSTVASECGVLWTNGTATSSSYHFTKFTSGGNLTVARATSWAGAGLANDVNYTANVGIAPSAPVTVVLGDDNTSRTVAVSASGAGNIQVYSGVRTTPFTPTYYGVACATGNAGSKYVLTLLGDS